VPALREDPQAVFSRKQNPYCWLTQHLPNRIEYNSLVTRRPVYTAAEACQILFNLLIYLS
jgi:hypothetical protein